MKLLHVSDSHGWLGLKLPEADIVVHSGDFLPNKTFGIRSIEEAYQPYWIEQNAEKIRNWIGDRALLITHGNHDFIDSAPHLRKIGIEAYNLDDTKLVHGNLAFYGFPWVPEFGPWNRGCSDYVLEARLEAIEDFEDVDILVAHSPIFGLLDRNATGERCGSKPMRKFLQDSAHVPNWVLCGHIHESHGIQTWSRGIQVSNAATICRVIDV